MDATSGDEPAMLGASPAHTPVPDESSPRSRSSVSSAGRSIGAILVDTGRLTPANAERIMRVQKEKGVHFGQAAVMLGLLTEDDIRHALAYQFAYLYLPANDTQLSRELVAAYQPFSPAVENLRALRSQLMLRWFDGEPGRKALAIVSPGAKEGRSHIAANLAVVCSQLGERTLLIDADLRNPRQHRLFKLQNKSGLSEMLTGHAGAEAVVRISALLGLSVLPAGATPAKPEEILGRASFLQLLHALGQQFEVIIIDTPASTDFDDAHIVASQTQAALIVTRNHRSLVSRVSQLARNLQAMGTTVVGSVLNEG
jgi:chain length determinant protein tyrosine kinase EpsG